MTDTDWATLADRLEMDAETRSPSGIGFYYDPGIRSGLRAAAVGLRRLAQLDTAESVGVDYCTLHHGIRNEDAHRCDMADDDLNPEYVFTTGQESVSYPNAGPDGEPRECVLVELIPRPAVLGSGEQPEATSIAARHQAHYRYCGCLGDSSECCDATCPCHSEARGEQPEGPTTAVSDCPTCWSTDPAKRWNDAAEAVCPDSWHGEQR